MNFADQISISMKNNREDWALTGPGSIENKKLKIAISQLGNVGLDYVWPFSYTYTSIASVKVDGVELETTSREKGKIEKAFFNFMRGYKIKGA